MGNSIIMLTFNTHPQEVKEMQDIINSGRFFSVTFLKKDNSIRYVNGKKIIYQSTSPSTQNKGKFDRLAQNILLVWDNNRINDITGERGQYISVKLDRLLFFKSGSFVRDYTEENADAIRAAGITPEQIQQIKTKIKIDGIVQEELTNMLNETAELLGLPELAEYMSRVGYDVNIMKDLLDQEYKTGGDEAVRKAFLDATGINLTILGRGKYAFKY